jgi:hypothetical protein
MAASSDPRVSSVVVTGDLGIAVVRLTLDLLYIY